MIDVKDSSTIGYIKNLLMLDELPAEVDPKKLYIYMGIRWCELEKNELRWHFKSKAMLINTFLNKVEKGLSLDKIVDVEKNVYLCSSYCTRGSNAGENIKYACDFFAELDNHVDGLTYKQGLDITERIKVDLVDRGILPMPTYMNYSGRGIHIHWGIVPTKNLSSWDKIEREIQNIIKRYSIDNGDRLHGGILDTGKSAKGCLLRLPGTTNTLAGKMCEVVPQYSSRKRYTMDEMRSYFKLCPEVESEEGELKREKEKTKSQKWYEANRKVLTRRNMGVLEDLCLLQSIRNTTGNRLREAHTYTYWQFSLLVTRGDIEETRKMTKVFNNGFKFPIDKDRLEKECGYAIKWYKSKRNVVPSNRKIIERLDITSEELEGLSYIKLTKQTREESLLKQRENNRNELGLSKREQSKYHKVVQINECKKQGMKVSEISKVTGIADRTIRDYWETTPEQVIQQALKKLNDGNGRRKKDNDSINKR